VTILITTHFVWSTALIWYYPPLITQTTFPFRYYPHSFQSNEKYWYKFDHQNFQTAKIIDLGLKYISLCLFLMYVYFCMLKNAYPPRARAQHFFYEYCKFLHCAFVHHLSVHPPPLSPPSVWKQEVWNFAYWLERVLSALLSPARETLISLLRPPPHTRTMGFKIIILTSI